MAEITAALVKKLREKASAGIMDCKKALAENGGDLEASVDWLRTKGLATAANKAGRMAAEGLIGIAVRNNAGAVVEVNTETDFVARNETFQEFVKSVAEIALDTGDDIEAVNASAYPETERNVQEQLTHLIATIGENMVLRRVSVLKAEKGTLASYIHNALAPGLGKIGSLVSLESESAGDALDLLGKQLAMHVAAAKPQALSSDDVDPNVVAREKLILVEQARESGRSEEIIQKMVEGRLRKFYEEVCLLDQTFVIDGETKVSQVIDVAAKEIGKPIVVNGFILFILGERIEKGGGNFAAEVSAAAGV